MNQDFLLTDIPNANPLSLDEEMEVLDRAIAIARQAHAQQLDKAGKPYIDHPLRVMDKMQSWQEKIVAVLHDAVEDSDLTLADLHSAGFPQEVVEAIAAITRNVGEDYETYLQRVMGNAIALKVKIADMTDNMDMSRIPHPTDKDWQRLAKYQRILPQLINASFEGRCNAPTLKKQD